VCRQLGFTTTADNRESSAVVFGLLWCRGRQPTARTWTNPSVPRFSFLRTAAPSWQRFDTNPTPIPMDPRPNNATIPNILTLNRCPPGATHISQWCACKPHAVC
jgi:hypothetical protein